VNSNSLKKGEVLPSVRFLEARPRGEIDVDERRDVELTGRARTSSRGEGLGTVPPMVLPPLSQYSNDNYEPTALHDMASLGRVHAVENIIQTGVEREPVDFFGRAPLHVAAAMGHEPVVRLLTRLGAKLDLQDKQGQTPLHLAAHNGQSGVIPSLLELRADAAAASIGIRTALHHAVDGMQPKVCRQLIQLRSDPEVRDKRKDSPLTMAVRCGHTAVLNELIDSRCDLQSYDSDGATPLHVAACKQRLECLEVLVRRGARTEATDRWGLMPLHWAARSGETEAAEALVRLKASVVARTIIHRQTPLHLASVAGQLGVIDVIVNAKANLDLQDNRGFTAVHVAVEHNRLEALKRLLQNGAGRDHLTGAGDAAIHLAVQRDRPTLVQCLMTHDANVNSRGRGGRTALHLVAEMGSMRCATVLLESAMPGSSTARRDSTGKAPIVTVSAQDELRQTPLHLAAYHNRVNLCAQLARAGAEIDAVDSEECTPLSLAVTRDHSAAVVILLKNKADPMRKNPQELGPLQQACTWGSIAVTKTLAEMKMIPKLDEEEWRRPMALAKFYGHQELVDYFFMPCPKSRLLLKMVRVAKVDTASVTFLPILSEPPITAVVLQAAVAKDSESQSESFQEIAAEREVKEEEWLQGRTLQLSGLAPTRYLLRLVATSDAGTTEGNPVELDMTEAPPLPSRAPVRLTSAGTPPSSASSTNPRTRSRQRRTPLSDRASVASVRE